MPVSMDRWQSFWSKVDLSSGECWIWTGTRGPQGYGRIRVGGRRSTGAHRFAWEIVRGPVPDGLFVCHRCDNPPCVRPDHLFLGTASDNAWDCARKGRRPQSKRTHCPQGHEYSAENTYRSPRGHRGCRTCLRAKARQVSQARKADSSYKAKANARQRESRRLARAGGAPVVSAPRARTAVAAPVVSAGGTR